MMNFADVEALEMELPDMIERTESLMENLNCALDHAEWLLGYLKELNEPEEGEDDR